jgi:hypothetical protein
MTKTHYKFRWKGNDLSETVYNGRGYSYYVEKGYITTPSNVPSRGGNWTYKWDCDKYHSDDDDSTIQKEDYYYYYDCIYYLPYGDKTTFVFLFNNGVPAKGTLYIKWTYGNMIYSDWDYTIDLDEYGCTYDDRTEKTFCGANIYGETGVTVTNILPNIHQKFRLDQEIYVYRLTGGVKTTWWDDRGKVIRIDYVEKKGTMPTPPDYTREGWTLLGWTPEIVAANDTANYTARMKRNTYHVEFYVDDVLYHSGDYQYEDVISYIVSNPTKPNMIFNGWSPDDSYVCGDKRYDATWRPLYTVKFVDGLTGEEISSAQYEKGATVTMPTIPTHEGYTYYEIAPRFNSKCTGDVTYTFLYKKESDPCTLVEFYDFYGHLFYAKFFHEELPTNLTLKDFEKKGLVAPILPDTKDKVFWDWGDYFVKYDGNVLRYEFWANYMDLDIVYDFCDNQADDIEDTIKGEMDILNLHVDRRDKHIKQANDRLHPLVYNNYVELQEEIELVKGKCKANGDRLLLLEGKDYDAQITELTDDINTRIEDTQDNLNTIKTEHERLLGIYSNQNQFVNNSIVRIEQKLADIPEHYFMTQREYDSLTDKDTKGIYLTPIV